MPRKSSDKKIRKTKFNTPQTYEKDKQELWKEYVGKLFLKYFPPNERKKMTQVEVNQRSNDLMTFLLFKLENDPPDFLKDTPERDNLISQMERPKETVVI